MTLNESISSAPFGERFNYASRTRLYPFRSKSCARAEFVCAHSEALLDCELSSFMTIKGLTPLDYFLWVYVKSLVYADKPQTLDHLKDNICRVIADIRPQMLEKVIENWTSRLDYIRASRGSHMPEILFKM
ncbi:hypothetical protein TNCV_3779451 [Trichonephila clavipes]|nr:hypothetical protein TNCV_3779451 [Trichonephila clavipes]